MNEHLREGLTIAGNVEVMHPVYVILEMLGLDSLRHVVKKPLSGLKVASYYGRMLTRPKDRFDAPKDSSVLTTSCRFSALR